MAAEKKRVEFAKSSWYDKFASSSTEPSALNFGRVMRAANSSLRRIPFIGNFLAWLQNFTISFIRVGARVPKTYLLFTPVLMFSGCKTIYVKQRFGP